MHIENIYMDIHVFKYVQHIALHEQMYHPLCPLRTVGGSGDGQMMLSVMWL